MASRVVLAFALALVGLCLASCNGVQGRIMTGEDGLKVETNLESQYNSLERPYIIPKSALVNVTNASPQAGNKYIKHWALSESKIEVEYYGTKASVNAWALPDVKAPQASFSGVWLFNGVGDELNVIQAGWHVHPQLYGDSKTRFFTFWTADNTRKTGCFNLLCTGFVLKNNTNIAPGAIISPLSTYDGDQHHVVLTIYKDIVTGDWWLRYHLNDEDIEVGFWPYSIFTHLSSHANVVQWGGFVGYSSDQAGPPMGSGHFPAERFGKTGYFKDVMFVSQSNNLFPPADRTQHQYMDDDQCYYVNTMEKSDKLGWHFYFGGPAGCRG